MPTPKNVPRDIEDFVADVLRDFAAEPAAIAAWKRADDLANPREHSPFVGTTAEFITRLRTTLAIVPPSMQASDMPGYESAPKSIKRVYEALFNPPMVARLLDLIMKESDRYDLNGGSDTGQSYMEYATERFAR